MGLWKYLPDDEGKPIVSGDTVIAYMETPEDESREGEFEANARLIESAPTMLEALKLAQLALNAAPRYRVGETDSYRIASQVDRAILLAIGTQAA